MPKFSPLCFNLPVNPSIQVMRSLDSYNDVELKKFQINKKHFSNIIYPQNKKINNPFIVRENPAFITIKYLIPPNKLLVLLEVCLPMTFLITMSRCTNRHILKGCNT